MDFKLTLTVPVEDILREVLNKYKGVMLTNDIMAAIKKDVTSALDTTFEDTQEEEQPDEDSISIMA